MNLSTRLLEAIQADKGKEDFPNLMKLYEHIKKLENDSYSKLHDLWGLKRPFGLGNLNGNEVDPNAPDYFDGCIKHSKDGNL